jgi:hypothetical protein
MISTFNLPDPKDANSLAIKQKTPSFVLEKLKEQINDRYPGTIEGLVITSSEFDSSQNKIKHYAFYLLFKKSNQQYRFIEVTPDNPDGAYPVQISAFSGPSKDFGSAKDDKELAKIIDQVLAHERARFIILSNY